ncbi:hypothetical protein EV421DRAFT_1370191 [Armillaria borealis]|uniref:Uncharacterized protein n=1 Tax=Armillaria borealis TaxID=47425 RepID=A0AA39J0H7_9AGAR|nr:hypothetical protein EV421DRAFT_1370191 [Armillaria borealis]
MPADISCECKKCARLPSILRYISRDLARKHLKKHGPALLVPVQTIENDRAASSSVPQRNSSQPSTAPDDDPDPFDLQEGMDFDDPGHDYDPAEREREPVLRAPVPAPDDRYEEVIMPPRLDFGRDDPFDDDVSPIVPPAFAHGETTAVRLAYLQAVYNNVFCKIPVSTATDNLNMTLNALDAAGVLPLVPPPVRTLTSAKKHLGIDPDAWIIPYTVCPRCWKHYTPHETEKLNSPACLSPGCVGTLYTESKDAKGRSKRRAVKILPQVSLLQSLRRMVRRKGFRKLVRDSRGAPRNANDDDDFVMKDMYDGSLWHDMSVGIKREVGNYGTVRDTPVAVGSDAERLTDKRFGLHLNGNLDWFGALENRPHSSGPIYVTIQDLQLGVRYLQVNTICVMVTPGPSEPTTGTTDKLYGACNA